MGETRSVWRTERCNVCQKLVDRRTLRLMPHDWVQLQGHNYLLQSAGINGTGWGGSGTDRGLVSYGSDGETRHRLNRDNTWTMLNGAQTWSGNGSVWTTDAYNVSAWTALVFAAHVGVYQGHDPRLSVVVGVCNNDGSSPQSVKTWSLKSDKFVWGGVAIADVASPLAAATLAFYVAVTPTVAGTYWWVTDAMLLKDPTQVAGEYRPFTPELDVILRTTGTASTYAADQPIRSVVKVCPKCVEPVFSKAGDIPRPEEPDEPLSYFDWEI
jgi:hypothetical protein